MPENFILAAHCKPTGKVHGKHAVPYWQYTRFSLSLSLSLTVYIYIVYVYIYIYIYMLCLNHANLDKYMQILSRTILYSLATLVYTCKSLDLCCQMLP